MYDHVTTHTIENLSSALGASRGLTHVAITANLHMSTFRRRDETLVPAFATHAADWSPNLEMFMLNGKHYHYCPTRKELFSDDVDGEHWYINHRPSWRERIKYPDEAAAYNAEHAKKINWFHWLKVVASRTRLRLRQWVPSQTGLTVGPESE